jgi:magnesium transporter
MRLGVFAATFLATYPIEAARALERLPLEQAQAVLDASPVAAGARCLEQMIPAVVVELLGVLSVDRAALLLTELPIAASVRIMRYLPRAEQNELLSALTGTLAAQLRISLKFPASTVGARVDPRVVILKDGMTVGDAIMLARRMPEYLRKYLYITDQQNHLSGVLDVRQCLIVADSSAPIDSIVSRNVVFLRARSSATAAKRDANWRRFDVMPVVDRDGVLLGVVRRRNLLDESADSDVQPAVPAVLTAALDVAEVYWDTASRLFLPVAHADEADEVERNARRH